MKTKILITLFTVFSLVTTLSAQDIITKKDGTKLKVIIKEINEKTIKYVDFKDPNGIIFSIDKILISGVTLQYGKNITPQAPKENTLYFADDKINNLMFGFSSFSCDTFAVSYEKVIELGSSWMVEAKIYGLGINSRGGFIDNIIKRNGVGFEYSYRLKTKSLFNKDTYRPKHVLHGAYFAPTAGFSTGKITYENYDSDNQVTHTILYFGLYYGKQFVLQRQLTVDASTGLFFYFGDDDDGVVRLGNMVGGNDILFAFNLRIGFLTGKQRL